MILIVFFAFSELVSDVPQVLKGYPIRMRRAFIEELAKDTSQVLAFPSLFTGNSTLQVAQSGKDAPHMAEDAQREKSGSSSPQAMEDDASMVKPVNREKQEEPLQQSSCLRPTLWCTHPGAAYSFEDCNGDGRPDHVCRDIAAKGEELRFLDSEHCIDHFAYSCDAEAEKLRRKKIELELQANLKRYKKAGQNLQNRPCERPDLWCTHGGSSYTYEDCNGDGIEDHVCHDGSSPWVEFIDRKVCDTTYSFSCSVKESKQRVRSIAAKSNKTLTCIDFGEDPSTPSAAESSSSPEKAMNILLQYDGTPCNDQLLSISHEYMDKILKRQTTAELRKNIIEGLPYQDLRSRKQSFYFAAIIKSAERMLPHLIRELITLLFVLASDESMGNLYVSLYESGSNDGTPEIMKAFEEILQALGVKTTFRTKGMRRDLVQNRISFLANARNLALKPLIREYKAGWRFHRVIWLSDNMFCAHGLLEQVLLLEKPEDGGANADVACGMDFGYAGNECLFYDKWASHDIDGRQMTNGRGNEPILSAKASREAAQSGLPFQVFACWSGSLVYRGEIFQEEGLLFRRGRKEHGAETECPAAETQLIYHDLWELGYHRIVMTPNSRSAYDATGFELCVKGRQERIQAKVDVKYTDQPPREIECCSCPDIPLGPPGWLLRDEVQFSHCQRQEWRKIYRRLGVPRLCGHPKGSTA